MTRLLCVTTAALVAQHGIRSLLAVAQVTRKNDVTQSEVFRIHRVCNKNRMYVIQVCVLE